MQIDLGAIALQAVNCCLDQIKNSCAPIATGCAKSKCVWKWTPDSPTCSDTCTYVWSPNLKFWSQTSWCPKGCTCPPRPTSQPKNPERDFTAIYSCIPSVKGSWSLDNNCFTCCKCPQLTPPPKPTDPTKAQEISYDCEYNCECSKCSYVWIPPTTTKCTNTGPCQLYWDATAQQYILGYRGDGSSTFDPCNSQCPCSLWGTTPNEPEISRLIAGECTPITSEGGWKFNSSCNYPCQCDLAAPVEPPSDPTKSEKIYGACRVCDCIPCTCEYTWFPTVPCKAGICTLYWNADTNQYSATTPDGTSTSNPCTATCPCSLLGSSPPPGTPSMLISGECTQTTPVDTCSPSSCIYVWTPGTDGGGGPIFCGVTIGTEPKLTQASPAQICTTWETALKVSANSLDGQDMYAPCLQNQMVGLNTYQITCVGGELVLRILEYANQPTKTGKTTWAFTLPGETGPVTTVWTLVPGGGTPSTSGSWSMGSDCPFPCVCSSGLPNFTPVNPALPDTATFPCKSPDVPTPPKSGFWAKTRGCSDDCLCPPSPTLDPAVPTVSSSKTYTCAKNLCGQCGWTWQTDGHVWAPSSSCNSGCLCPISMPTWQPSNPDAGNTSVVAPCVPDTCATSKCDYDWLYSYVLEKWQFLLIKNCPNGCECSPIIPLEPPENPDRSTIVSFDCKSIIPPTPDPCQGSFCSYNWSVANDKWEIGLFCNVSTCTCPAPPPAPEDRSKPVHIELSCFTGTTSTTPPPTTCTDPTKPCLWFCTPPADGIGPPQWVYSGGAEQCPSKTCLPPTYLCQVGNENTYGCGPCLPSACDASCVVDCAFGKATVSGCNGYGCICTNPDPNAKGQTPQQFCEQIGNGTRTFLCVSSQSSTTPPPPNICIFGACTLDCKNGVVVYLGENNNCGGCVCGGDTLGPGGSYRTPQMICKTIGNGTVNVKCVSYF